MCNSCKFLKNGECKRGYSVQQTVNDWAYDGNFKEIIYKPKTKCSKFNENIKK